VGIIVNVPLDDGLQVEALFTHQNAHLSVPRPVAGPTRLQVSVDHWQGGALQEFDDGRVRPYLSGMLGLTRYGTRGDNEVRFTLGVGGGLKLFPTTHVGVRLNSQVSATFVDGGASVFACSSFTGTCFVGFNADVVWQVEFTAGLIVRLPWKSQVSWPAELDSYQLDDWMVNGVHGMRDPH
jgi:hypothetical protein